MSFYTDDLDNIMVNVREAMEQTRTVQLARLRKVALATLLLARKMAPVDEGDLENAIELRESEGGRDEFTGRFVAKQIEVYVDGDKVGSDGKRVGDYAYFIHEHLEVFGETSGLKLGKRSMQKQMGQNFAVGGLFLDRALALAVQTT